MNISSLLHFESMRYQGSQTQAASINLFVASSLRVFIEDFFQRMAPSFMVIISCRRPSPANFYRNIMELLYQSVDTMILELFNQTLGHREHIEGISRHNLVLVDSLQALLDIEIHKHTAHLDASEYYFIFLQQRDALLAEDMQGIFEYCWQHQLLNCNVMTQTAQGVVQLYTYFPYTARHCGVPVGRHINTFLGESWQQPNYFPVKLRNMHRCALKVLLRPVPPFVSTGDGASGLEDRLLQELAKRMNFKIHLVQPVQSADGVRTEQQVLQLLQQQQAHLTIGYMRKRVEHTSNLSAAFPHYSSRLVACLLYDAHNLTSLELLSYPFQTRTWLWVLSSFLAVAGLLLCTVQRVRRTAVLFSLLAIAWGQPVTDTSGTRPAHQLVYTNWLCFTLLVRSMYSALFYQMLRQQVHQRLPRTLEELLRLDGYVGVMNRITLQDVREVLPNVLTNILQSDPEHQVLDLMNEHTQQRLFGVLSHQTLLYVAQRSHKPGAYYVLPQPVLEQQLAIYLQKHSHLLEQFDELILSIQAVGLLNYWAGQMGSERYFRSSYLYQDRRLCQSDLWGVYFIVGVLYVLAVLVFVWEVLSARWR